MFCLILPGQLGSSDVMDDSLPHILKFTIFVHRGRSCGLVGGGERGVQRV